jgi:hypothetical protein
MPKSSGPTKYINWRRNIVLIFLTIQIRQIKNENHTHEFGILISSIQLTEIDKILKNQCKKAFLIRITNKELSGLEFTKVDYN